MKIETQRYERDGRLCGPSMERDETPGLATTRFLRFELGYGGRLTKVEPTRVEVYTSMMGRYDITIFSGTKEEMLPMMYAISFWAAAQKKHGKQHNEKTADAAIKAGLNTPLLITMITTVMFGGWVNPALCASANLTPEQAETLLDQKLDKDTFDSIIELVIDGSSFEESLALAA